MAKKKEPLDEGLNVPVTRTMKKAITDLAEREQRKLAEMGRMLWREALDARKHDQTSAEPDAVGSK